MLFNCMVMHGVSAASLEAAVLVPIPKDKRKGLSTSDNYRALQYVNWRARQYVNYLTLYFSTNIQGS